MTDAQLRLEALQLARQNVIEPDEVLELAARYLEFLEGDAA
jgi:hypothetical protein